jgi:hydrogenase maturation protein HypF
MGQAMVMMVTFGAENFLKVASMDLKELGTYVMMPGSDSAVKHPWRMAVSYLYSAKKTYLLQHSNEQDSCEPSKVLLSNISQKDIEFTIKMLEKQLNCPKTSSMGRFFDAVSALLGINTDISYEGQAAIELEYYAMEVNAEPYNVKLLNQSENEKCGDTNLCSQNYSSQNYSSQNYSSIVEDVENNLTVSSNIECDDSIDNSGVGFVVQTSYIIEQIIQDMQEGHNKEYISSRFHSTIAEIVLQGCILIRKNSNLNSVVLSGGVFQNITLLKMCVDRLRKHDFNVYTHSEYPANDGGIALGQAVLALGKIISRNV